MNPLQAIQSVRGISHLGDALQSKRSLGDVAGAVVGTVYATQSGGLGSLASGMLEEMTSALVDGVVSGVSEVVDTSTAAGRAVASYTSQGVQSLGKLVDFFA
ncbi:hypothetical protein [Comamonas sp. GB3 AK4-5]|uniref:hypothetical protein n=1 Tax=Comamonas sp. GB3 AK4-5 TaxID=3231487 RepID=UPI00351ECA4E